MNHTETPNLDPQRERLLANKLGSLFIWRLPDLQRTVGPFQPEVFEKYDAVRKKIIEETAKKLQTYCDDDVIVLLNANVDDPDSVRSDWRAFSSEFQSRLKGPPAWYAGGFGHPDHVADFEYWAKLPQFHVFEVTQLSVGINPTEFKEHELEDPRQEEFDRLWPSLQFLIRRYQQIARQFDPRRVGHMVNPVGLIDWSERVEFELHPEFLRPLKQYHVVAASPANNSKKTDQREVDSIAQIVTAIAIDAYGFRPHERRSPIPNEITSLMASMGMEISDDTIRKYLRLGARFISSDWKPPEDIR